MRSTSLIVASASLLFAHLASASPTPQKRATTAPKYVIAHHIVGNTYPYVVSDWLADITLAKQYGIDAFALNVGPDSWQPARVADAYTAASQANNGFKLFLSLDMSVLSCSSTNDAATLTNWVSTYSKNPSQFLYPPSSPKVFVSTFSGSACTFGQSSASAGWTYFKSKLTGANSIYFVPSYFIDPATFGSSGLASSMDGAFQWNSAWQIGVTTASLNSSLVQTGSTLQALPNTATNSSAQGVVKNLVSSVTADGQYISPLRSLNKTYMASVSPWFYTHYSPQTYNKNWVYLSDYLYPLRWQSVVSARGSIDLAEVITWNDYGESHYIGPIKGAQPNSQAWVNGMDHTPWLNVTSYYATAYKTGSYPAIVKDQMYIWARPHPANATASSDSVGKPNNYQIMQDSFFVMCLATNTGTINAGTSLNANLTTPGGGSGGRSYAVNKGMNLFQVPLVPGGTMWAQLVRSNKTVLNVQPSSFKYVSNPTTYNYNAFVAGGST